MLVSIDTICFHWALFLPCWNCVTVRLLWTDKSHLNVLFLAATCGGTIRGYTGRVTSPSYPRQYPNNLDCSWRLIGPPDHYLILWFDDLSMPLTFNCTTSDYVAVTEQLPLNSSGRTDLCFLSHSPTAE